MIVKINSRDIKASTGVADNAKLTGITKIIAKSRTAQRPMIFIGGNSFRNLTREILFCIHIVNTVYENNKIVIR